MSDLMEAPPMRKTGGDPPKRPGRRARFVRVLVALVVVGAATALVTDRTILSGGEDDARPGPQRILDGLVAGPGRVAPAYDPQGPISGPHANGYEIAGDGQVTDRTNEHVGKGADGGIVSDATDTATFLTRLMQGELLDREHLYRLRGDAFWNGGLATECAGTAFDALGAGDGYIAYVLVNRDGSRVAVLLLNGRRAATGVVDEAVITAATNLYCAA